MKIYPKISIQDIHEEMKKIVSNSEGIELQFFNENGITEEFNFEDIVRKRKKEFPNLKEITVHPPLDDYHFELLILKDKTIVEKQFRKLVELSKELNIKVNIIYHTNMTKQQYISTNLIDKLRELLQIIEGTNVVVMLENLFMMLDEKIGCSVIKICKYIDHPNLRACIDTTHLHCKSSIWKIDFVEMLKQDFNKEDCKKYVKQIHFAAALNNDGYIDKKTHGRMHREINDVKEELDWLKRFGMDDKIYVTEVSEEDYYTRVDQIREIKMIQELIK